MIRVDRKDFVALMKQVLLFAGRKADPARWGGIRLESSYPILHAQAASSSAAAWSMACALPDEYGEAGSSWVCHLSALDVRQVLPDLAPGSSVVRRNDVVTVNPVKCDRVEFGVATRYEPDSTLLASVRESGHDLVDLRALMSLPENQGDTADTCALDPRWLAALGKLRGERGEPVSLRVVQTTTGKTRVHVACGPTFRAVIAGYERGSVELHPQLSVPSDPWPIAQYA